MASSTIDSLFDHERLAMGNQNYLPLLLYSPVGALLFIVRVFILLHALVIHSILPQTSTLRSVVLRVMLAVTGLVITSDGDEGLDARARVLVANHVSPLDHPLSSLVVPHVLPSEWGGSTWLQWLLGLHRFAPDLGREELIRTIKKFCQDSPLPLLFFPEKIPTNGKHGILKFSDLAFKLNCTIQPIGIQTKRISLFPVNVSTSSSAWWADLFWCLFLPFTVFKIKLLPVTQKKDSESEEEFCERVRGNMAKTLDLHMSEFSAADVMERRKRPPPPATPPATPSSPKPAQPVGPESEEEVEACLRGQDPEVARMVRQIKEVLTDTPVPSILQDLLVTRDVDVTITNILEGRVPQETPCRAPAASSSSSPSSSSSSSPPAQSPASLQFKAAEFGKSTQDRQMSFQERKRAMIETARRKYMAKHGMI